MNPKWLKFFWSKKRDLVFDAERVAMAREILNEKQSLENEKLRSEIQQLQRSKIFEIILEKLLIAGVVGLVGFIGNLWLAKIDFQKQQDLRRLEQKLHEENEEHARTFELIKQQITQNFQEKLQTLTVAMQMQQIESQKEESKMREYLNAELQSRLKAFSFSLDRSEKLSSLRLSTYSRLYGLLIEIETALSKGYKPTSLVIVQSLAKLDDVLKSDRLLITSNVMNEIQRTTNCLSHDTTTSIKEFGPACGRLAMTMQVELSITGENDSDVKVVPSGGSNEVLKPFP